MANENDQITNGAKFLPQVAPAARLSPKQKSFQTKVDQM